MAGGAGPPPPLLLLLLPLLALPAGRANRTGPGESRPGMGVARGQFGDAPRGPGMGSFAEEARLGGFAARPGPAGSRGAEVPVRNQRGDVEVSGDLSAAQPRSRSEPRSSCQGWL